MATDAASTPQVISIVVICKGSEYYAITKLRSKYDANATIIGGYKELKFYFIPIKRRTFIQLTVNENVVGHLNQEPFICQDEHIHWNVASSHQIPI